MAGSVNKVILVGNLGRDPDVRHTNDGKPIVHLAVATSESWRDRNSGERQERTEWHRVVIFAEGLGKVAQQYLRKGSKVYLEGQLQTRKWTDQQGAERYMTEVVLRGYNSSLQMLDRRDGGGASSSMGYAADGPAPPPEPDPPPGPPGGDAAGPSGPGPSSGGGLDDDDIPF